jgi:autotransporter-associated beta strand protein
LTGGAQAAGSIVNNGTLIFGSGGGGALSGQITGSGEVIYQSAVAVLGANSYAGGSEVAAGGTLTVSSDSGVGAGTSALSMLSGSTLSFAGGLTFNHALTLSGDPTISVPAGATVTVNGAIADGVTAGDMVLTGGGQLVLDGSDSYSGGSTIGAGILVLGNAAAAGTGAITFGAVGGQLWVDGASTPANVIAKFVAGDTIDLRGISYAAGDVPAYTVSTGELDVVNNGVTVASLFFGAGDAAVNDPFHVNPGTDGTGLVITNDAPCFCPGTRIGGSPAGPLDRPAEDRPRASSRSRPRGADPGPGECDRRWGAASRPVPFARPRAADRRRPGHRETTGQRRQHPARR